MNGLRSGFWKTKTARNVGNVQNRQTVKPALEEVFAQNHI